MMLGRRLRSVAAVIVISAWLTGCGHLPAGRSDRTSEAELARQILITVPQETSRGAALLGSPDTVYLRRRGYGPSRDVDRQLEAIANDYGLDRMEGWGIASLDIYCEVYSLPLGQNTDAILAQVSVDPRVQSAQPMHVFDTQSIHYDDPYASMQPAIAMLSIDAAHERATGRGVTVAVVDSSVDYKHPEMRGRVKYRRDLVGDRRPATLAEVHGTAVAGIIAAMTNNEEGIVGVAPDVDLASLRACWTVDERTGRARCSSFSLALALETALQLEVDVINLSLSGPEDPLLTDLIDQALERGIIVIAAVRDGADSEASFPASHTGVIAAGSSGTEPLPALPNLLRAPGSEVLSTIPDGRYAFFSGNSMSAAFVAGVSALLLERSPGIGADEVLRLLTDTSTVESINACRAIASPDVSDCPLGGENVSSAREALSHTKR
ncbi:MAG: S8 family peptidase [Gammaproteobacteria bacterium]